MMLIGKAQIWIAIYMQKVKLGSNNFVENVMFKHPFGKKLKVNNLIQELWLKMYITIK